MLTNIEVNKLFAHPNNPRKDLGDLTELSESIKARGIMQNLTVIPAADGHYTVVIGHRRLAAAQLAGLKTVPCVIAEMDEKEQISTMLLENMQRSDLTVIEQAQGFQLMLDLGETPQTISAKTGFSETTVRKRLFVASLDAKKTKAAYERGATLEDYVKLQQITDRKSRNELLESIGTCDYNYLLRTAIAKEVRDRVTPKIIEQIKDFASPTEKHSWELKGYGYYSRCSYEEYEKTGQLNIKIPKKWKPNEYLYFMSTTEVNIYKQDKNFVPEKKMNELSPAEQEERRETRRKYKALKEAGEIAYQLRLDFVESFCPKKIDAVQIAALAEFAFAAVCVGDTLAYGNYAVIAGIEANNDYQLDLTQKKEKVKDVPASRVILISLYSTFRDNAENIYFYGAAASAEKRGKYRSNEKLNAIYGCLCALGYQMSDAEQAMRDGSHKLFLKEEDKDEEHIK